MINKIPQSIEDFQNGLKNKSFSAVDLVGTYLSRIEKYDKDLNSFITISKEKAYEDAKRTDRIINEKGQKAFEEYPLLGVVISYKDIYLTKGIRTTAASKVLEGYIPEYSGTVVKRLEEAGSIMIGKTNCDAWAHGSSGENSDFGPTKNPWNKNYIPGGSSSGSGVAVAADFSLAAMATDTCGSIRLPANYCGVVGLKPTYGSVSRYGVIAMASSLDSIGHITHTVSDSQKIFECTKGVDGKDSTLKNSQNFIVGQNLKIGIPKEFFEGGLDNEVEKSIEEARKVFEKLNIEFVEITLPSTKYAISTYYIIQPAEVSSNLGRFDGIRYGNDRNFFGDEAKRRIMLGTFVLSSGYYDAYYSKAMKIRTIIIKEVEKAFEKVDAIMAPVAPTPPFKLGEKVSDPLKMYLTDIFAATANLSGIPSLAIPSGLTKNKLPLGFQLMGKKFEEDTLFHLGKMYQNKTNFHGNKPQGY
ncbi:Asp-tRNA(Asn)/Glu-tRNA(Gln) amidotransferase subunit GatA [Candidatus Woesebacteria bacterium]|nr:Asp-tRNA(Asn)/Glu-tRNA(Gln) amidotransferase subunit GatA [Candidatus Woesebacteria bacterium]QQG47161.1 MAG: Asp-tRNA(Asn)/Glu-tRNA(Gln) amidotransferase subunit GatA [Candidatus Woesebacteria bacterium]